MPMPMPNYMQGGQQNMLGFPPSGGLQPGGGMQPMIASLPGYNPPQGGDRPPWQGGAPGAGPWTAPWAQGGLQAWLAANHPQYADAMARMQQQGGGYGAGGAGPGWPGQGFGQPMQNNLMGSPGFAQPGLGGPPRQMPPGVMQPMGMGAPGVMQQRPQPYGRPMY